MEKGCAGLVGVSSMLLRIPHLSERRTSTPVVVAADVGSAFRACCRTCWGCSGGSGSRTEWKVGAKKASSIDTYTTRNHAGDENTAEMACGLFRRVPVRMAFAGGGRCDATLIMLGGGKVFQAGKRGAP